MSKNNLIATRVIYMILGVLIGVALVILGSAVTAQNILNVAFIAWGVIVIISNIPGLIYAVANLKAKGAIFDLIMSILGILLGVGLIVSRNEVVTLILAAYMIVFPVIRIVLAKSNWGEQLKREALRIILGVVLLVFGGTFVAIGMDILNLLLKIIGWVVIGLVVVFGAVDIVRIATKK